LNHNAGAVQALSTIALFAVTAWYVFLTSRIVIENKRHQRPYVYVDVEPAGGPVLEIGVGNYGDRAAQAVSFKVHSDIADSEGEMLSVSVPFLGGIEYIPPGRTYRWRFIVPRDLFEGDPGQNVLDVELSYSGSGEVWHDRLRIDLSHFGGVLFKSFRNEASKIAQELSGIRRHMESSESHRLFRAPGGSCPSCGEEVAWNAKKCPHCHEPIVRKPHIELPD
jgi:hypothetical protein